MSGFWPVALWMIAGLTLMGVAVTLFMWAVEYAKAKPMSFRVLVGWLALAACVVGSGCVAMAAS